MNARKKTNPRKKANLRKTNGPLGGGGPAAAGWNPAGRVTVLWLLILALVGWTVIAFPRLTLPFSVAGPMVAALDSDVLFDGVGLTPEQRDGIRGAIGTRPVGIVFVPEDQDDPTLYQLCTAIGERLPDIELALVKGPGGAYGCSGDDVPLLLRDDQTLFGAQAGYEMRIGGALGLVADPVGKAQSLALVHDSMVLSGRLADEERNLRTPWSQVLTTLLVVGGVLAGVVLALTGLRWATLYLAARTARRQRQEEIRDRLDDGLAELALVVVDRTPDDPRSTAGGTAAEYVELLNLARTIDGGWAELLDRVTTVLNKESGTSRRKDRS